jgi:hypothetical protein
MSPKGEPLPEIAEQIALFDLADSDATTGRNDERNNSAETVVAATTATEAASVDAVADTVADTSATETGIASDAADAAHSPTVWERLPAGEEADGHAIVVSAEGSRRPSGHPLTGPVDSIAKLAKLIGWAGLQPMGAPAQVWIVGMDACEQLGWMIDPGSEDNATPEQLRTDACTQLEHIIGTSLEPMLADGWELRGTPGHRIHLSRTVGKSTAMVDVILEPYAWTMWNSGDTLGILGTESDDELRDTELPSADADAARELGRRLAWSVKNLGVLPGHTGARTGAAVLDKIRRERKRTGKGLIVSTAGPVPPLDNERPGDLEPAVLWTRLPEPGELDDTTQLITIDQRAAYLASAGMITFGTGASRHVFADEAETAARETKRPFGLWLVTLPAAASLNLPARLPLPHPHMRDDQAVSTWVTTVSLEGLTSPVVDGGAGLDVDDLAISEAWIYAEQGRALESWAATLRTARQIAATTDDRPMKEFTAACYKGYIGRMLNPDMWTSTKMQHHHQPLWRASIMAHSRWRGRRAAMRIARETGRWPLRTVTDSWVYAVSDDDQIADDSTALGKLTIEKQTPLSGSIIEDLYSAHEGVQVRDILARAYREGH